MPPAKTRGFLSFTQLFFVVLLFVFQIRLLLQTGGIHIAAERVAAIPALLLYVYVSVAFSDAEYMSLFGVKNRWTVADGNVWERTNRLASRLMRVSAALMIVPMFFIETIYWTLLAPPALSFFILYIYSAAISRNK
jgi:uncharacterized membrane protein